MFLSVAVFSFKVSGLIFPFEETITCITYNALLLWLNVGHLEINIQKRLLDNKY